jgi:hypothetical protein
VRGHLLAALPSLAARLGIRTRCSGLALAASIVASAAPAEALSFFAEDLGTGALPAAFPSSSATESAFLALLADPATEDFSGFDVADKGPLAIFAGGPVTATLSDTVDSGGSIRAILDDGANRGFATSGDRFWKNETTPDASDELFRVGFDREVLAFGFYATAWATESSPTMDATRLALYLERAGMPVERIEIPHDRADLPGDVFYFGVIADLPFVALSLRNESTTDPGDRIGFDDLTVATAAIPEPATALLLLAGLAGLAAVGRRQGSRLSR